MMSVNQVEEKIPLRLKFARLFFNSEHTTQKLHPTLDVTADITMQQNVSQEQLQETFLLHSKRRFSHNTELASPTPVSLRLACLKKRNATDSAFAIKDSIPSERGTYPLKSEFDLD